MESRYESCTKIKVCHVGSVALSGVSAIKVKSLSLGPDYLSTSLRCLVHYTKYKGGYLLERHCAKLINKAISISRSQDHLYATPSYYM